MSITFGANASAVVARYGSATAIGMEIYMGKNQNQGSKGSSSQQGDQSPRQNERGANKQSHQPTQGGSGSGSQDRQQSGQSPRTGQQGGGTSGGRSGQCDDDVESGKSHDTTGRQDVERDTPDRNSNLDE